MYLDKVSTLNSNHCLSKDTSSFFGGSTTEHSHSDSSLADTQPTRLSSDEENHQQDDRLAKHPPLWYPFWMQPIVLSTFAVCFGCVVVALSALLVYSSRHDGLGEANQNYMYLWRFGPISVITLIGVMWARVELQTLRYMPWIILRQREADVRSIDLDLDYTVMLPPVAWYQSLKRRHPLVFFAITATVLLKIQVVLAASLFRMVVVDAVHQVTARTLSSFALPDGRISVIDAVPLATVYALDAFNLSLPFGVAPDCAYQTFTTDELETDMGTSRPTIDRPVTAVVDGLFVDVQCAQARTCTLSHDVPSGSQTAENNTITIDFDFEECGKEKTKMPTSYPAYGKTIWGFMSITEQSSSTYPWCSSFPPDSPQVFYWRLHFNASASNASFEPALDGCAAVLCWSDTWISPVEVTDDGDSPIVAVKDEGDGRTSPFQIDPWREIRKSRSAHYFGHRESITGPIVFDYLEEYQNHEDLAAFPSDWLENAIRDEIKRVAPMLSHYQARQHRDGRKSIIGSRITPSNRLQIKSNVCLAMITLSALMAAAALIMSWQAHGTNELYSRDPATILGTMAIMHGDLDYSARISQPLRRSRTIRQAMWTDSTYSPLVLRWWSRALFATYALGLAIGLSITLQESKKQNGLADIDDTSFYLPLLFQSLPALAMLGMSLHASSSDTAIRGLSDHISLSVHTCLPPELDTSLLDMLGVRALVLSVIRKLPAVTMAQILALVCGILPTMSSTLFQSELIPASLQAEAEQLSWFGYRVHPDGPPDVEVDPYLLNLNTIPLLSVMHRIESDFSYPQNTYDSLVFPSFSLGNTEGLGINEVTTTVNITMPAAKLHPSCVKLDSRDYNASAITKRIGERDVIQLEFGQNYSCSNTGVVHYYTDNIFLPPVKGAHSWALFGAIILSPDNMPEARSMCNLSEGNGGLDPPWRQRTYIWGNFTPIGMRLDPISAWRCNYSWFEVPTQVNLLPIDGALQIDRLNPPLQLDAADAKPWNPPFAVPILENDWGVLGYGPIVPDFENNDARTSAMSSEFQFAMEPFGPLRLEVFGDEEQDEAVLASLHSNTAFFAAQIANRQYRLGLKESSASNPYSHPALSLMNATVTDQKRYRLTQSAPVTHAIVAILAVYVAANVWVLISTLYRQCSSPEGTSTRQRPWLLAMDLHGLAPQGFTNFAMTEALLVSSNIFANLPQDSHLLPAAELQKHLAGKVFKMGWFFDTEAGIDRFTIGALEDDGFIFRGEGWRVGEGEEKPGRRSTGQSRGAPPS